MFVPVLVYTKQVSISLYLLNEMQRLYWRSVYEMEKFGTSVW